jgi:hypothetical protein
LNVNSHIIGPNHTALDVIGVLAEVHFPVQATVFSFDKTDKKRNARKQLAHRLSSRMTAHTHYAKIS